MKAIGSVLLLSFVTAFAAGEEERLNDAFLLRQLQRHPAADLNQDGRLTAAEWREYRASERLKAEMADEEASALRSGGDTGKRVPPTHAEVAYGPLPEQRLNLWIVPSERPAPLILHIHGGGFIQGSKQATIDAAVHEKLVRSGVSYASVQYKFQSADHPLTEVLRGIARAPQFLRHGAAKWNLDPARFAGFGSSAGAAACAWLGMRDDLADPGSEDPVLHESTRLQAVWAISVAPSMDVWEWPKYNPLFTERMVSPWIRRWGYDPDTDPEAPEVLAMRQELQFSRLASPDAAPMVVYNAHFADNVAHNPAASKALYELCKAAGMEVEVYLREELDNLAEAPDPIDWLIERLLSLDPAEPR